MKLEVGCIYKTRSGSRVRVRRELSGKYKWLAKVNGITVKYTADGKFWADGSESDLDVVSQF